MLNTDFYIHPDSLEVKEFISKLELNQLPLQPMIERLLEWFNENIEYTRLNAPYYPLQRSDIDVLNMRLGTCGDYSNLVVSVLLSLGYEAKYAYLKKDCYGDLQDHICAAVWDKNRWILIDATNPYRKWHGFDCQHQEYELLTPKEFREKFKEQELYWTNKAMEWNDERYAGLLYAPWVHEDIIVNDENAIETVFYLAILENKEKYTIYVNYLVYDKDTGVTPIMCTVDAENENYRFSVHKPQNLWDDAQWGDEYTKESIPSQLQSERLERMMESMHYAIPRIKEMILLK